MSISSVLRLSKIRFYRNDKDKNVVHLISDGESCNEYNFRYVQHSFVVS